MRLRDRLFALLSLFIQQMQDQSLLHLRRLKAERPAGALENDFAVAANDVKPIRHSAIEMADAVVHAVHHQRDRHLESRLTLARDRVSLLAGGRVRLADVDVKELCPVAVATFQLFDGPKLGPIGASGEAAEDQHHRLARAVRLHGDFLAVRRGQREVGGRRADRRPGRGRADFALKHAQQQRRL
jgi:hypothetical protein